MKRNAAILVLAALLVGGACDRGDKDGGGFQEVDMDVRQPGGTVTSAQPDPYRDAAVGTVGTDAEPRAVTGDGREGPDTAYRAGSAPRDTVR